MACQERWYDNLAACVLGLKRTQARSSAEESAEQDLVEALEQKYDALKDKLLTEALMKQVGAAEWASLSERERQAKLLKLKLQERKLRQEGKLDEASRFVVHFSVFGFLQRKFFISTELKQGRSWATNGNRKFNFSLLTPFDAIISLMASYQR